MKDTPIQYARPRWVCPEGRQHNQHGTVASLAHRAVLRRPKCDEWRIKTRKVPAEAPGTVGG